MNGPDARVGRRAVLASTGTLLGASLAGCLGNGSDGDGDGGGRPEPEQQLPTPVDGDPDAPVTVAAFEDFACPHCATYSLDVVPRIREEYVATERIRYEWYDFPIPVDETQSWLAADAARAVQANSDAIDDFWEFTHRLFERQSDLGLDLYERMADEMGLDGAAIRTETDERTYEPTVVASQATGEERGVSATPTVFVNDEQLEAPGYADLSDAIDAALENA